LAYDAVALTAALAAPGRAEVLRRGADQSVGFAGIDGLFRFRADGTNQRGLAVMRVASGGGQAVAACPRFWR